jgi:hypothetical protein
MTDLSILYTHNPDVTLREATEQGGLLFNPDTNQVQVLNSTGVFLWDLCDGTHTLEQLFQALDQEFDHIPAEQVEDDVMKFITGLKEEGFLAVLPVKPT